MLALKMSTKNVLKEKVMPWEKRNIFKRYAMARRDFPERVTVSIPLDICPSLGRRKLHKNDGNGFLLFYESKNVDHLHAELATNRQ